MTARVVKRVITKNQTPRPQEHTGQSRTCRMWAKSFHQLSRTSRRGESSTIEWTLSLNLITTRQRRRRASRTSACPTRRILIIRQTTFLLPAKRYQSSSNGFLLARAMASSSQGKLASEDSWTAWGLIRALMLTNKILMGQTQLFKLLKSKITQRHFSKTNFTFLEDMMERKIITTWEFLTRKETAGKDPLSQEVCLPRAEMVIQPPLLVSKFLSYRLSIREPTLHYWRVAWTRSIRCRWHACAGSSRLQMDELWVYRRTTRSLQHAYCW